MPFAYDEVDSVSRRYEENRSLWVVWTVKTEDVDQLRCMSGQLVAEKRDHEISYSEGIFTLIYGAWRVDGGTRYV